MSNNLITAMFPRPRPYPLGGRAVLAGELTLNQRADLQAWLDARHPDPLVTLRDRLGDMDEGDRRKVLVPMYDVAEAEAPAWGGPEAAKAYTTGEGVLHVLRVGLSRHNPGLTEAEMIDAASRATPAEYAALQRAFRGVTPLDEIEGWLGANREQDGTPITWVQVVAELMEAYPGLSVSQIGELTVTQVRALRSGGKPQDRGTRPGPGMNLKTMLREARKKFRNIGEGGG